MFEYIKFFKTLNNLLDKFFLIKIKNIFIFIIILNALKNDYLCFLFKIIKLKTKHQNFYMFFKNYL